MDRCTHIILIVAGSVILSFVQEYNASTAVQGLRSQIAVKSTVVRASQQISIPAEEVVPGDIVLLAAGSLIPADGIVLESNDLYVNQSALTGETFPVQKQPGVVAAAAVLSERTNAVFMGSNVRSGSARVLVVQTGSGAHCRMESAGLSGVGGGD